MSGCLEDGHRQQTGQTVGNAGGRSGPTGGHWPMANGWNGAVSRLSGWARRLRFCRNCAISFPFLRPRIQRPAATLLPMN